jgi:RNA polymerase sigma-70 factor (ECF subfamily)
MTTEAPEATPTERLFREHAAFVARFLQRLGVPSSAVDDLLQEVFLVVHRQGGYRPGLASETTYLAGIAVGVHANHRRKERTRFRTLRTFLGMPQPAPHVTTPVHLLEADETQRQLLEALDALGSEERSVLVMADFEELPCAEIASVLSVPLGTVYWRLSRAREGWLSAFERAQRVSPLRRPTHSERSP